MAALLTGCAMLPAKNAEAIRYNHLGMSADNICYLETPPGVHILAVDGRYVRERVFDYLDAGRKSLTVRYARVNGGQYLYSSPTNISFDFEAGHFYTMDHTISGDDDNLTVNFTIKEIADPLQRTYAEKRLSSFRENLLELDAYLTFSKEDPDYFEGKWVTDAGKTLEFAGNEFKFSKTPGSDDFSGTFIFDENTLIMDVTKLNSSPNEYMFTMDYKRDGNNLFLSGKGVGLFIRAIIDDYARE
jgi:hypothetical protein